ncbi:MAG: C39 family peptidase [Nitrospirae bacterium]|nr:C39 family peptidase [Candidatus Manganitrophaceae bacterium]
MDRLLLGRFLLVFFYCLSSACASTGSVSSAPEPPLLLQVPYFPQQVGLCGPASLTAVLTYWHEAVSVDEVTRAVYLPQLNGTLGIDLALFARKKGMRAESFVGSLDTIRDRLSHGIPLIAFLNLGYRIFPVGHFVVVTGIDEGREEMIVHSGDEENKRIPYRTFMAAWEKTEFWALQIVPGAG